MMIASCKFVNNPVHFTAVKFYFDTLFLFWVVYIREKVFQKWFAYCFGSVVRTMKIQK